MGLMAMSAGVLSVFLMLNWYLILRRKEVYVGWRRWAALIALAFPTAALCGELVLTAIAYFHPLNQMNGTELGLDAWGVSFIAVGVLGACGFVVALVGKGSPRIASLVWSMVACAFFFINSFLVINSFH